MAPLRRKTESTMTSTRWIAVLLALFTFANAAFGAGAEAYVKAKQGELTELIKKPRSAESDASLVKLFDGLLDYDALAKESLGDEWDRRSPEERKEFQQLLSTLVQRAYTKGIRDTLDYDIAYKGETDGKAGKIVQTVATHKTDKRKEPVHIDYVVRQAGSVWRVVDIVTEGSSLVLNYRNQFRRVIEQKGFSGLLEKMRTKAAEPS
jgi:phospholipid transport system substrate-binding protein